MTKEIFSLLGAFLLLAVSTEVTGQSSHCDFCGAYYLEGGNETASGFKINADSTFEFFFSSGALDRYGSGKWKKRMISPQNEMLHFNSDTGKTPALKIVASLKKGTDPVTLQLTEPNPVIAPSFYLLGFSGKDTSYAVCNAEGWAQLESNTFDSIGVVFEFCPDHLLILHQENQQNYFEIKVEPWLFEYFFINFSLHLEDGKLTGSHPLLKGNFIYSKP